MFTLRNDNGLRSLPVRPLSSYHAVVSLTSPPAPQLSPSELLKEIPTLFATIDIARTGIAHIQHFLQTTSHPHSHTHHQPHNHANDYPTTLIRYDRDLLDLGNMIHVLLERARGDGQLDEGEGERMWSVSCSRVRRGLKCLAFYAQVRLSLPPFSLSPLSFLLCSPLTHSDRFTRKESTDISSFTGRSNSN